MEKYDILPTEENIIETLCNDIIDRNKDIVYFYKVLQAQETASSIAIDGKWGSGKTFFVHQVKLLINTLNPSSDLNSEIKEKVSKSSIYKKLKEEFENCSIAVYYDAWKNDNDIDPIFSLIYEITKQMSVEFSLTDTNVIKKAGLIIDAISRRNISSIIDSLKSNDTFTNFEEEKKIEDRIKEFFSDILAERGNRLVVFVDELDRCKPTFAVHLLEQIKHYILDDRITFVFSVNIEQLQHTIKHHYGSEFDSCRYLDRFFDFRIPIPPANMEKFYNQIGFSSTFIVDRVTKRVINMLNLELREITRLYSQVKAAVYEPTHDRKKYEFVFPDEKGKQIILTYIVPLIVGLQITDVSKYQEFINGRDVEPLKELFSTGEFNNILENMLNSNESFVTKEGKLFVTLDEIVERFYQAVFIKPYSVNDYNTKLGEYGFSGESKEFAVNASSMLSGFVDFQ